MSIRDNKKSRGRPKTTGINPLIGVRLPRDLLDGIDRFIAEFPEAKNRPEAVRRLVREKLENLGYLKPEDED